MKFPKTLVALKEAALEETDGHASDSAYWAVGDALIEECGVDPVWDVDIIKGEFKGGLKLREAARWLAENGMEGHLPWSGSFAYDLLEFRETSERFPPETRRMNVPYCAHCECDDLEELARLSDSLGPGEVLSVIEEEIEARIKYGPC